ncbi:QWRF family [Dillenia turbinata]|uniref:QWRF family n=1 Tax=Dillenia turbinata TaxID=194707 RepID=A0AAN8ZFC6_9MAGN
MEGETAMVEQQRPPPPTVARKARPRVREVSSRFLSASPSPCHSHSEVSGAASPLINQHQHRRSRSAERRSREEPSSCLSIDEKENLLHLQPPKSQLRKQFQSQSQRLVASNSKIVKENSENKSLPVPLRRSADSVASAPASTRPGTPMVPNFDRDRMSILRSSRNTPTTTSAAAKLLHSTGLTPSSSSSSNNTRVVRRLLSSSSETPNPDHRHLQQDLRSSVPDADMLSSSRFDKLSCSHSLDFPLSTPSADPGTLSLPPLHSRPKLPADSRKAKKPPGHNDDVHYLRLLHNYHLQWRFANAKAEASALAQTRETEKALYSQEKRLSDLRESVRRRRIELAELQRKQTLYNILQLQMPYLEEWSAFEGDYNSTLLGLTKSLQNASIQLPILENVKADVSEIEEALASASKVMDTVFCHVEKFMAKAEEIDCFSSEMARVAGGERALFEECQGLLNKVQQSQVEECSLRGQVIQLSKSGLSH